MIGKKLFIVIVLGVLGTLIVIGAIKFLPIQKASSSHASAQHQAAHGPVKELTTVKELSHALKGKEPMIIKFHAEWCGACTYMKGPFAELAHEFSHMNFYEINVDDQDLMNYVDEHKVSKSGVEALPTFVLRQGDTVKEQIVGGMKKEALAKEIKKVFS